MKKTTGLLLVILAIFLAFKPKFISDTINLVILSIKNEQNIPEEVTKTEKVETKNSEIEEKLLPSVKPNTKKNFVSTLFMFDGRCTKSRMFFEGKERVVTAAHCVLDDPNYDGPVFEDTKQFLTLVKPDIGKAYISLVRDQKPLHTEIIINKIEGCYAYYSTNEGVVTRQGDSGARIWVPGDSVDKNKEKILIGVVAQGDYKTREAAAKRAPSRFALFAFCRGRSPITYKDR